MVTKNLSNKIHIIGSVGSGKTTLAKKLAAKLEVPFYELDNVVWKRHKAGDIRRSEKEREEYLNTLIDSDAWIIEGVHNEEWVSKSFQKADTIIFLDTKYAIRNYRILKRFILQKIGLEKSNYTPTLKIFFKMFKWNRRFEEEGKLNFFEKYGMYCNKTIVVTNKKQLEDIFF
ncbi:shikimate kinase [Virgibacillus litoralis]|uniref:Adenylate kinase family enzyme n=1 Tax=Virgibacillus litoralis TaxID=578221 RepID=A0ABS4HFH5_9BACI|nr:AAA family ATPase [Virgibacillus litoralis]MBP1949690.1 adenylate kinase family enzyme [Virgibacillus litoralis]